MAPPNALIAEAAGLQTQPNELTLPAGSLTVAENVEITRDGVVEVARGFADFSENLPDFLPEQIIVVGGVAYLHLDNGLWYHDGTRWLRKRGALGAKAANPHYNVVLADVLFYTTNSDHCVFGINLATGEHFLVAGRFGSSGSTDGTGDTARFNNPRGLATDGTSLYVCDSGNHTVRRIAAPASGAAVVTTIAGTAGASGSADGVGSIARFSSPWGLTCDGTSLFVCDAGNHTVRNIAAPASSAVVTTIAGTAGANGSTDDTGAAARFKGPLDVCLEGDTLYLCDNGNHTIRKLSPPLSAGAAIVTTIAGTALSTGSADGIGAAARFSSPTAVASDGTNLFVSDNINHTIRKLAPPLSAGAAVVTTFVGTAGTSGTLDGIGDAARLNSPQGLVFDDGALYLCDATNCATRKIYPSGYVSTLSGLIGIVPPSFGVGHADGIVVGPPE